MNRCINALGDGILPLSLAIRHCYEFYVLLKQMVFATHTNPHKLMLCKQQFLD